MSLPDSASSAAVITIVPPPPESPSPAVYLSSDPAPDSPPFLHAHASAAAAAAPDQLLLAPPAHSSASAFASAHSAASTASSSASSSSSAGSSTSPPHSPNSMHFHSAPISPLPTGHGGAHHSHSLSSLGHGEGHHLHLHPRSHHAGPVINPHSPASPGSASGSGSGSPTSPGAGFTSPPRLLAPDREVFPANLHLSDASTFSDGSPKRNKFLDSITHIVPRSPTAKHSSPGTFYRMWICVCVDGVR